MTFETLKLIVFLLSSQEIKPLSFFGYITEPFRDTIKWITSTFLYKVEESYDDCNRYFPCDDPIYPPGAIYYHLLYWKENREFRYVVAKFSSNLNKFEKFDIKKPMVIATHGWTGECKIPATSYIVEAYHSKRSYNVICMTWTMAKDPTYVIAKSHIRAAGLRMKLSIENLIKMGMDPRSLTLIGFSLGAHVVGIAGSMIGRVQRVIGLDPAGPLIKHSGITIFSGKHVEIVHTCAHLGRTESLGHTDFYVNGGEYQPGCSNRTRDRKSCSHDRASLIWVEALNNPKSFVAMRCESYQDFLHKPELCLFQKRYVLEYLGSTDFNRNREYGSFYFKTAPSSPFGLGERGIFLNSNVLY